MSKNILPSLDPETALPTVVQAIERQIRQFKSGIQGPTTKVTQFATVQTVLHNSFSESGTTGLIPQAAITSSFEPPNGEVMLAFPEFDVFWTDLHPTTLHEFPNDTAQLGATDYLRLKWWLDFAKNFAAIDNTIYAYIISSIDGALFNASGSPWDGSIFTIGVRWRYIVPGSSQLPITLLGQAA